MQFNKKTASEAAKRSVVARKKIRVERDELRVKVAALERYVDEVSEESMYGVLAKLALDESADPSDRATAAGRFLRERRWDKRLDLDTQSDTIEEKRSRIDELMGDDNGRRDD